MSIVCKYSNTTVDDLNRIKEQYGFTKEEIKRFEKQCLLGEYLAPVVANIFALIVGIIFHTLYQKTDNPNFFVDIIVSSVSAISTMFLIHVIAIKTACPLFLYKKEIEAYLETLKSLDSYNPTLDFQESIKKNKNFSLNDEDLNIEFVKEFTYYINNNKENADKIIKENEYDFSWIDEEIEDICKTLKTGNFRNIKQK